MIEVILEAYPHLVKHSGPNPQVMLEVVRDPEAERSEQLFAYILTSLDTDEALDRLDRLDEEWFLDQFDPSFQASDHREVQGHFRNYKPPDWIRRKIARELERLWDQRRQADYDAVFH